MPRPETANYAAVLADLREQRARLDAAIRALETVHSGQTAEVATHAKALASKLPVASFAGLTVYEAAIKHLESTSQGQRTVQILRALQQGGVGLKGKSPINGLGAILNSHLKRHGKLVKLKRGVWGLAAWPALPGATLSDTSADATAPVPKRGR